MIDDFLLVLFPLQLRDNLTMKKQMELNVLGCSSERKTALFCLFLQALYSPKGSKRVCRDARRVKWRRTLEKRGCLAIMTNGMQCLTCFREEWFFAPIMLRCLSERRTCMASAIGNIFSFYFGRRRFLTPESSEKILSSR